ncbi:MULTISPECIES: hypothetical protein [unclassified Microbulbifer]|uniref:hypothetical protein n=1 Tax=unclassified Microbulbifer TaxID=2619833 RepID=UPI0027E4B5AB|nr:MULTISPECIES: hypothetical protein [unclassified Microbulbifer]
MAEEYRIAWMIYGGGTLVLLAAGWWFMRNWSWAWLRYSLLLLGATVLLVPARTGELEAPSMPVLPLFVYQTLFEAEGATPEVTATLVFAGGGALALLAIWGLTALYLGHRREQRRQFEDDPFFNEQ